MKLKFALFTLLFVTVKSFSQENSKVLFSIDKEPIYTQEFIRVYNKNLSLIDDSAKNSVEEYLNLFVDYKLKVKQARELKIDTLKTLNKELKQYQESLSLPYLKDKDVTNKLVSEAYERLLKEINVSHILVFAKPNAAPADTLKAYNSLIEARNLIINGADFAEIAKKYSQDPSVKQNGGDIGYFTALQMVYPFENVAYNTAKNEVSMPFRTKFGFHILKLNNERKSLGEVEVAHIMLKNLSEKNKQKIDSIYNLLVNDKQDFFSLAKIVSEDGSSAPRGGKMAKFSYGRMVEDFSKQAFALENNDDISKPFKTKYGWHIAKLIKKYPVQSFEEIKASLTKKIEKDSRSNLIGQTVLDRLFKEYNITVNKEALKVFDTKDKLDLEKLNSNLLSINDKKINQKAFAAYLKGVRNPSLKENFKKFKENEVLTYYKENLKFTNPKFAATLKEFNEGLMLFELLERKVWNKSKDSIGLNKFYNANKVEKYNNKELKSIKGTVISDYQNALEKAWIAELRNKYTVEFNKSEKRKVLKKKF
ncbi:peptidyl-prolyl cis-trans isomerase SurA [Lutibacter oricola]|uniref:Peptidyl-prolyl cis-trans isomerase SurA n=1 Tax=Lutibacter oricola TaxID=762486 RepID=A0A1H2VSA4_9FLAO|nr:peptidylprolyl isomerase [Lutibacter oricola]SDW71156.1 peptidyl-prolyl cis-trans isomerase SurA [Lutibacter oricola]